MFSLETCAKNGGIFNNQFTANLPSNLPVKFNYVNRLRFDRTMAMSLWPHFLVHRVDTLKREVNKLVLVSSASISQTALNNDKETTSVL